MKLLSSKHSEAGVSFSLLLLRFSAGATLLVNHGLKKITGFNEILEKGFFDPIGIGSKASLYLITFAEVFCAILIIFGLLTRLASIPLIIGMSVIVFLVSKGDIFGQAELPAIYLAIFIALLISGPGRYSLDRMIGK